jgi:hypothetical protein
MATPTGFEGGWSFSGKFVRAGLEISVCEAMGKLRLPGWYTSWVNLPFSASKPNGTRRFVLSARFAVSKPGLDSDQGLAGESRRYFSTRRLRLPGI